MYHRFSGLLYWSSIRIVVNHVGGYWIVPGNNYLYFLEWEIILKMMTLLAGAGHRHTTDNLQQSLPNKMLQHS